MINVQPVTFFKSSTPSNPVDPHFANVILYLKGDGANDSKAIVDSSNYGKTLTLGSTSIIKTAQSKYGGSSLYFDKTTSSIITVQSPEVIGTGDFTMEAWVYPIADNFGVFAFTGTANYQLVAVASNKLISYFNSASYYPQSATNITYNAWSHFALTRESGRLKIWENGIFKAQSSLSASTFSAAIDRVGTTVFRGVLSGYIDSARITKEVARYTGNFNPETDTFLAY